MYEANATYATNNTTGDPMAQAPRAIESASASTACQTNGSKFAYVLTAGVLGIVSLLLIAIALLIYSVFTETGSYQSYRSSYVDEPTYGMYDDDWYDYGDGDGDGYGYDYHDGYFDHMGNIEL